MMSAFDKLRALAALGWELRLYHVPRRFDENIARALVRPAAEVKAACSSRHLLLFYLVEVEKYAFAYALADPSLFPGRPAGRLKALDPAICPTATVVNGGEWRDHMSLCHRGSQEERAQWTVSGGDARRRAVEGVQRRRREDVHIPRWGAPFAVKTGERWRAAGKKYGSRYVMIHGKTAVAIAEAIYREMGVDRRVETKYDKKGVPYIQLTNIDLELLGLR